MKPPPFIRAILFALVRRRNFLSLARIDRAQSAKWAAFARGETRSLRLNSSLAFRTSLFLQ